MILVLFGTNPYSFDRLSKGIENYAKISKEKMIAQLGNTNYEPKGIECFNFIARDKLYALIDQAELVIAQGGYGSIMDCIERGKRIVAVPRKRELNECKDDGLGQEELVRELDKEGKLVGVYDINDLPKMIEKARRLHFSLSVNDKIQSLILDFVKKVYKREK